MNRWTQCAGYLLIPGCWRGACQCRAQCPGGPWTHRIVSPAARARPAGTSQSSTFSIVKIFIWLIKNILGDTSIFHDICYFFHSPWPDIVLMIGFIVELTREPELFPHWRAAPLEIRVDGVLVLAINLQTRCWKRAISKSSKYSPQSWQTARSWAQIHCPVSRVSVKHIFHLRFYPAPMHILHLTLRSYS